MASYTQLKLEEANEILALFELPKALQLTPLGHGISNTNYKVILEKGQAFVLKLSNDKDENELLEEYKILNHLKNERFPYIVAPLKNKQGKTIFDFKNHKGALFPYSSGEVRQSTAQTCFLIGQALASLHAIVPSSDLRSYSKIGQDWNSIEKYLTEGKMDDFIKAVNEIVHPTKLKAYQNYSLPWGIVHGDLYYDNVLFQGEKIATVLDFEQAGTGPLIWDLGICLSGNCWDTQGHTLNRSLATSLIEGYESVRPLSDLEKELIDEAIIFGFLSVSLWRIQRFVERGIDKNKYYSYRVLLERALIIARKL